MAQRRISVLKNQLGGVLGMAIEDEEDQLTDSIERELRKMDKPKNVSDAFLSPYALANIWSNRSHTCLMNIKRSSMLHRLRKSLSRTWLMWATSTVGRPWRTVRRPSDMGALEFPCFVLDSDLRIIKNEYSRQIKELRAQEKPGKTHGKVFVKGKHIVHCLVVFC